MPGARWAGLLHRNTEALTVRGTAPRHFNGPSDAGAWGYDGPARNNMEYATCGELG